MQMMLTFFAITIWNHSFVNFLSIFSSFQCFYIVRFEWDIVLSSSYDGWDKHGYTMWCPREVTSTLLKCVWLYLKTGNSGEIECSGFLLLKIETAWR